MPNKEKLRKWQKALESGEYQQGFGSMYNEKTNSYCCLGVAANLENIEMNKKPKLCLDNPYIKVEEIYGLTINDIYKFIELNDDRNKTFKEIAEFIEKTYLKDTKHVN